MPAPQRKVEAVKDIADRFKGVDAALLTEYRGLRVGDIAEVRDALRAADADYKVLKNTLARIAVREVGLEDLVGMLEGPTAIAFIRGDAAAAAKALDEAARKFPVLAIKGGVLAGKVIDADQARQLARLESREVLLAKIAMLANSPAQQAVNVFAALLRDLGSMLAQVVVHKEAEAPAEAPAPTVEAAAQPEEAAARAAETAEETAEEPAEVPEAEDQVPAAPESQAAEGQDMTEQKEE